MTYQYEEVNGFKIRYGKFYDPNDYINGINFEIRILHEDPEQQEALLEKIRKLLQ